MRKIGTGISLLSSSAPAKNVALPKGCFAINSLEPWKQPLIDSCCCKTGQKFSELHVCAIQEWLALHVHVNFEKLPIVQLKIRQTWAIQLVCCVRLSLAVLVVFRLKGLHVSTPAHSVTQVMHFFSPFENAWVYRFWNKCSTYEPYSNFSHQCKLRFRRISGDFLFFGKSATTGKPGKPQNAFNADRYSNNNFTLSLPLTMSSRVCTNKYTFRKFATLNKAFRVVYSSCLHHTVQLRTGYTHLHFPLT